MSLEVTSSITWWVLRPLMAANMPRIIGASTPSSRLSDLRDGCGIDAVDAGHRQGRRAARGGDLLDDTGVGKVVLVRVRHGPPDEVDRAAGREVGGDGLVRRGHVRDLLERRERRHLA